MGIEHDQSGALGALFHGTPGFVPAGKLTSGQFTPNQEAQAVAIELSWARVGRLSSSASAGAAARAVAFYRTLARYGHQAAGPYGYRCEQGAPAPHDAIWWWWRSSLLREARLQEEGELLALAVAEAAEEFALAAAFWTPRGIRCPGSRAKAAGGQALRPSWATCSWAYAVIAGLPTAGLDKPDRGPIEVLQDCAQTFPAIRAAAATCVPKLHIPIRRWDSEGGWTAALDHDEPMNDRLSWLTVSTSGEITAAGKTLDTFTAPLTPPRIIGASEPASITTSAPEPPAADVAPVPATAAAGEVAPAILESFAETLGELKLSRHDMAVRTILVTQLKAGVNPAELGQIADRVAGLGIGPGQVQALVWHRLVADMRRAAAGN